MTLKAQKKSSELLEMWASIMKKLFVSNDNI